MDPREFSPLPAEFSGLPPEENDGPAPARDLHSLKKRSAFSAEQDQPPETAPLPPEFGQTSGPQTTYRSGNRKRVKWLYAMAVILIAALASGSIGGSSQSVIPPDLPPGPSVIDEPGDAGDPVITIDYAYVEIAASSNYSWVEYSYTLDPVDTDWPISISARVIDRFMTEAKPEDDPDVWGGQRYPSLSSMETTGLDVNGGLTLVLTAQFTKDGEEKTVSSSAPVTRRVWKEGPAIKITRAEYRWAEGSSPAVVEYECTVDPNDIEENFSIMPSVSDENNYVKMPNTVTVSAEKQTISGTVPADGLKADGKLVLDISVEYSDNGTTVYKQCASAEVSIPEAPPEPEQQTYPLGDGTVFITVYNNSFDFESADDPLFPWMKILLHEEMNEADWQDITLPEADDPNEDWDPAGYVLHYNGEFDFGYDSALEDEFIHVLEGNVLTREDIELVPPTPDGSRYVNIHVMWYPLRNYDFKLRLELALNDGTDDAEVWEADQPFASEGFTYLAVFGEPERDGYRFTGWYDDEGNKVEYLSYYDFFDPLPNAQDREDRDWEHPKTIRLTAGWE